jgi:2-octaprenylphenol hydroxylase
VRAELDAEVAVVGSGLAGACTAALLARHSGIAPERIVLLDAALPPPLPLPQASTPPQLRVIAVSRASEHVLRAAGAWERVRHARLCPYERMRVWHESASPHGGAALCFDAAEVGEPNLGYIAENAELQAGCLESLRALGGRLLESALQAMVIEDAAARLQLRTGEELRVRLVVGADGARSLVRSQANLAARTRDYQQIALVAKVSTAQPHQHTAWQRFLSTGPLALLPLFDGSCSLVWSLDSPGGIALRDCAAEEFAARLDAATGLVLGQSALASERLCFPLFSLAAESYVTARCALIGDAAHQIHPLAGQGANLALLDAAALCEAVSDALARREDPGALRVVRSYEQRRRTHNLAMDAAMTLFQRLFAAKSVPTTFLVNRAFEWVNRSGPVKRWFAQQALGRGGELPRYARTAA